MKRVKEIIAESDVVRRKPLQPSGADTLDDVINARGKDEPSRSRHIDRARRMQNRNELFAMYAPMLDELAKRLSAEGFYGLARDVKSISLELENMQVDPRDIERGI